MNRIESVLRIGDFWEQIFGVGWGGSWKVPLFPLHKVFETSDVDKCDHEWVQKTSLKVSKPFKNETVYIQFDDEKNTPKQHLESSSTRTVSIFQRLNLRRKKTNRRVARHVREPGVLLSD